MSRARVDEDAIVPVREQPDALRKETRRARELLLRLELLARDGRQNGTLCAGVAFGQHGLALLRAESQRPTAGTAACPTLWQTIRGRWTRLS